MTKLQEVPEFLVMCPELFVKDISQELPPVRQLMDRICLIDPGKLVKTPTLKAPQALMSK